jgi:hypothetical protein
MKAILIESNSMTTKKTNTSRTVKVNTAPSNKSSRQYVSGDEFEKHVINRINQFCDKNGLL